MTQSGIGFVHARIGNVSEPPRLDLVLRYCGGLQERFDRHPLTHVSNFEPLSRDEKHNREALALRHEPRLRNLLPHVFQGHPLR